ncbi:unnamed protein product, partial [Ixodes persulcatus]
FLRCCCRVSFSSFVVLALLVLFSKRVGRSSSLVRLILRSARNLSLYRLKGEGQKNLYAEKTQEEAKRAEPHFSFFCASLISGVLATIKEICRLLVSGVFLLSG